jgi:hypothetical protein
VKRVFCSEEVGSARATDKLGSAGDVGSQMGEIKLAGPGIKAHEPVLNMGSEFREYLFAESVPWNIVRVVFR